MKTKIILTALCVIALAVSASCKHETEPQTPHHYTLYNPPEADDDTGMPGDDTSEETVVRDFYVNFEYRNSVHIRWKEKGDEISDGEFTADDRYGYGNDLVVPHLRLMGSGKVLRFPESKFEIHTLYFHGPAVTNGPCGESPISYALTLTGQEGATERQGGVAAYCGETVTGMPKRILRIIANWPQEQ